ncbi:uncharacterized protein LOC132605142 [Lycium barbarum]|uniref:uncharacterized protein LOC132605142 n=1 Tax=Lycium barbarum TaxID=112863 RepID=UPI00293E131A|nr:uncharacterized protein LOC132605142 [Lycium barbarum]
MPYARRWSRGCTRGVETHHVILPFRDQLDRMMAPEAFIWTPYDQILGQLPTFCRAGEHMWTARCPLIHMDIVEHHAPDRVLRQFGHVQNIPAATHWEHYHYTRDDRSIDSAAWRARMHQEVNAWNERMTTLATVGHDTPVHEYMTWYMHITRSLVANPSTPRPDGREYASLSGAYEALLRMTLMTRPESISLTESTDPGIATYAARIVHLTDTGMTQAHEWHRVDEDVPEGVPEGGRADRGGRAGRGSRAGRGDLVGGGGRAGRGLVDEPDDMSRQAPSATDTPSSSKSSTSQRPEYTPEMFPRYDSWSSFSQVAVDDLHIGGGDEDLDIIFDDFFLRSTAGPSAPSASPALRAAQEPSHMPSQELVDTQVYSSAPVDSSPPVQIDPSPPPATALGSSQETVEEPAKEPVDTHVHSSAPVVQSPPIESSPEASTEATQVETAAVSHRKHIFT